MAEAPAFDPATTTSILARFIEEYVGATGATGVVLGLSGGVDSTVVAALAARAVGPENVLGLLLPHETSDPTDAAHATLAAEALGIATETIDITPVVRAVETACVHRPGGLAAANIRPRARMVVLYAHANSTNRLVLGTGNKSELMVGYFTKFGDGAADLYPIGDVYKTDVWSLARHLGVPREVVEKAPTAGLWAGQRDEDELGIRYADLDRLLAAFEAGLDAPAAAERAGLAGEKARSILRRIESSEHKRTSLVIPKLGHRTPGLDWRLPRTRG